MNNITIIGRLTRDPEHTPATGKPNSQYSKFTVAVNHRFGDLTSFFDCIAFGGLADLVYKYLNKGRQCCVRGRMEQGEPYTDKNGNKRRSWTLVAEEVEFLGSKNEQRSDADLRQAENEARDLLMGDTFEAAEEDCPF